MALVIFMASEHQPEAVAESTAPMAVDYQGHALVRFKVSAPADEQKLKGLLEALPELDLWQHSPGRGHADVRVPKDHMSLSQGVKYTTGECAKIMYPCSGVAHDWAYGKAKILHSLAVEVRPGEQSSAGFLLPSREILPVGKELLAGVLALSSSAVPAFKYESAHKKKKDSIYYLSKEQVDSVTKPSA